MIRELSQLPRLPIKAPVSSPYDLATATLAMSNYAEFLKEMEQAKKDLEIKRQELEASHTEVLKLNQDARTGLEEHLAQMSEQMARLDTLIEQVKIVQKGDKGDAAPKPIAGVDYPIPQGVDHEKIVADILKQIPTPKDGESPLVDYKKVAKIAVQLIPKSDVKLPKPIDEGGIVQKVLDALRTGKKLSIKDIEGFNEGLEQTIAPIRSLAAGFKGGGDTVGAGTGTILTTVAGTKLINLNFTATNTNKITVSSTQPSNPVVSDLWVDTS